MFLKRIEMQGFKSFADRVVINFDHSVTGIVGPNGCGKSNITDAIRWVLGEQSVKSLRGDKMTDVIFQGSQDRKMVGLAEVTLVFDNSKKSINSELEEIEVTRRLYRNNSEAEYLINRNRVRLKDIIDLILDTGLGKDSLSMISQGNISAFAEAKPFERRIIFEEAAGVSKYKKRKIESINKLERTKDNLDRTLDILNELERQVSPLKRQARKAELYREKKQQLQDIEVSVLVSDIESLTSGIEEIEKALFDLETNTVIARTSIEVHETTNQEAKGRATTLEHEISNLQERLMKAINEIQTLETRKIELDEKSKYIIEVGDVTAKAKELEKLVSEAKYEFEDRKGRYDQLVKDIELFSLTLQQEALNLVDRLQKKEETDSIIRRLENKKDLLNNLVKEPFNNQQGVKSIMDNQTSLRGILGVVGKEVKPKDGFEEAIASALGGAMYHIATKNEDDARYAIEFLKKNRSGRATFLPVNVMRSNNIREESRIVLKGLSGYLGSADELVSYDESFKTIVGSLLANVIICENLEKGNKIAQVLQYNYKIVTLDGDIIHRGGSMSGGKTQNQNASIVTLEKELNRLEEELISYHAKKSLAYTDYSQSLFNKEKIEKEITECRINAAALEPIVDAKRAKFEKYQNDLELIKPHSKDQQVNDVSFKDAIVTQLNDAYSLRDEVTSSIKSKREQKIALMADIERKEQQIRQIRKELDIASQHEKGIITKKVQLQTNLEHNLTRLASEYQMTFEFARSKAVESEFDNAKDEVLRLRQEIESLGNINMNAPEEFSEVNTRYEFIKKNYDDLCLSRDQLLKAIEDMDQIMTKQFKEMFDLINENVNETFTTLFGGGKARLLLEDPNDLLNTGIDIDVQPPGKSVNINIRLLSGGEKTLIAFCVLFTILKVKTVPLVIFDEVDAALDQANVERFARYLKTFSDDTQFIVVSHRPGTMSKCDVLYGVTMQKQGVSQMLKVELVDALQLVDSPKEQG